MFLCLFFFRTYLHPNATSGQALSDSESVVTKPCLVSEALVNPLPPSKNAMQAFRLLNENPKAQVCLFLVLWFL